MQRSDREVTPEEIAQLLEAIPFDRIPAAISALAVRLLAAPDPEPDLEPRLERHLSPEEVADRLGTNRAWVYSRAELLGAVKLGRRTMRIPESNLADYLESCRLGDDNDPAGGSRCGHR